MNRVDSALRLALAGPVQDDSAGTRPGTIVAGLVGRGIRESRTPAMHEAEGARLGLAYGYRLLDFDKLGLEDSLLSEVIAEAARLGFAGLNVTHPFKESVVACLDRPLAGGRGNWRGKHGRLPERRRRRSQH